MGSGQNTHGNGRQTAAEHDRAAADRQDGDGKAAGCH